MRWGVFVLFLLVALVFDTAFMQVFAVGRIWPALVPCLLTFVALHGQRAAVLWAAMLAGFLVDCTSPSFAYFDGMRPYHLIGPSSLGFVLAAQLILPLRTMVVRKNPLALGTLTAMFALASMLVTTAIFSARGWYAGTVPPWMPSGTALRFMGDESLRALACGAVATILAIPLQGTVALFGFARAAPVDAAPLMPTRE